MQVQITLYGAMRVIAGQPRVDLPFAWPSITLAVAIEALIAAFPRIRPYVLDASGALHASIRVIRNDERLIADDLLAISLYDGDRVALLSPMAGGTATYSNKETFDEVSAKSPSWKASQRKPLLHVDGR